MRLLFLSNAPWSSTGYGQQTALFMPRLQKAGHKMAVLANYGHEGSAINWNGVHVFGKSFHPYGQDIMHGHAVTWKADALITLLDAWVIERQGLMGTKWIPWFPVDHITIPPMVFNNIKQSFAPITMSKSASELMDKTGIEYNYVPLGVDTNVFKPLDKAESREAVKFPKDKFIVGMVAMNKGNPSRKAFHQNIAAFAALKEKYKDCVLYLHTLDGLRGGDTIDLIAFCNALGLKYGYGFEKSAENADVIFADQYGLMVGYTPEMMAQLYSSFDVHLLVTQGEGFGVPIIEAQACGCPVIVGDWTSMPELCFSGWKVAKEDAEPVFTPQNAFQYLAHPAAIAKCLDEAYKARDDKQMKEKARKGALKYDADIITQKYWLPTLKNIEAKIKNTMDVTDNLSQNLDVLR